MNLNEIANTGNRALRLIRIWAKINDTKKAIKITIKKDEYDAYDIFNFLQFIKIAQTLNLGRNLPKNISFSYYKAVDMREVSSGTFTVDITYNKSNQLQVIYKPIISLEDNKINMEWIIGDNTTSIVDYKIISSDTRTYSSVVSTLSDNPINPTEPVSVTKILESSSAGILYQAFLACIESIFKDVEMRYKRNEKKK